MRLPVLILSTLALCGCATTIDPAAHPVTLVTHAPDSPGCKAVGDVTGHQGNWLTGLVTPDVDLDLGAHNDLKNKAYALGGTVVAVADAPAVKQGLIGNASVSLSGQAFKCPSWN